MRYIGGYKYQLKDDEVFNVEVYPKEDIILDFSMLSQTGILIAKKGYAWDGPSGPTFDTEDFMHASLAHDMLYQFIAHGYLDISWREQADKELVKICKQYGMGFLRRWYVYLAVRRFGGDHLLKEKINEI